MASSPCPIFLGAACRCNCIPNFAVDPGSDTVSSIWVIREASEGWNKRVENQFFCLIVAHTNARRWMEKGNWKN